MWTLRQSRRLPVFSVLIAGAAVSLAAPALTTSAAASVTTAAHPKAAAYSHGVKPNKTGELDCNGFSSIQRPAKNNMVCADPFGSDRGRFLDHGHYIGH